VHGFGRGDVEIVLEDPLRVQDLLFFMASVKLMCLPTRRNENETTQHVQKGSLPYVVLEFPQTRHYHHTLDINPVHSHAVNRCITFSQ
jgi:hypothetical protein